MSRFYCPQWSHPKRGRTDIPVLASTHEKAANDACAEFCERHGTTGRVVRKPHGWKPTDSEYQAP